MAENQKTYGLPNIPDLLSMGVESAIDAGLGAGKTILGGQADLGGILNELIGGPKIASDFLRNKASGLYGSGIDNFKDVLDFQTMGDRYKNRIEREQEDMTFADTFGERAEAKEQSVQEMLNELNQNAGLPDMGPVMGPIDTSKIKESNQSKAEAEASLQSEADQAQLFDNKLSADRASEKEASVADLQKEVTDNQEVATKQGFSNAMEDYLQKAGKGKSATGTGGSGARSLEDYKKEFAKATGIDIKGGPDKSNFLMALGLGLMQNRAGKGFDVSKILTSVGEATEKAMPKLEEAKKQYKAEQLAAGQYALKAQAKDKATAAAATKKLKEEKGYFIVPTGGKAGLTAGDYLGNAENGRYMKLSNAQITQLQANPDFNKNYSVLPGEMWGDIVKESIEAQQKGGIEYLEKVSNVPMFSGADDDYFNIPIQYANQNTVPQGQNAPPRFAGSEPAALGKLAEIKSSADRSEAEFTKIAKVLSETDLNRQTQAASALKQFARGFGINIGKVRDEDGNIVDKPTPEAQLEFYLTKIQAEEASNILQEAGKTLSDKDRQMVKEIVGEIGVFIRNGADKKLIVEKLNNLYGRIVGAKRRRLQEGAQSLYSYGVAGAAEFIDPNSAAFGISPTSTTPNFTFQTMPNGRLRLSLVGN